MNPTLMTDWPRRVAVLGVGLLGGSVALALRRRRPACMFVGYSRNAAKLDDAVGRGIIDLATDSMEEACHHCDVVVIAAPVDKIAAMVVKAAPMTSQECLITDVGSTKADILAEVQQHPSAAAKFIAAHPIAGSEKSGYAHASSSLFDAKTVVLTPPPYVDPAVREKADQFWKLTGATTVLMDAGQHDRYLAAVSHVPHLISALVARMVPEKARSLVGSGWQDITRVAAGDPEMWTAICSQNQAAVSSELERLAEQLASLRQIIESGDEQSLRTWLSEAKRSKEEV